MTGQCGQTIVALAIPETESAIVLTGDEVLSIGREAGHTAAAGLCRNITKNRPFRIVAGTTTQSLDDRVCLRPARVDPADR